MNEEEEFSADFLEDLMTSDSKKFTDELFTVLTSRRLKPNHQEFELEFKDCPLKFLLNLRGLWGQKLWVEVGDEVRVIGTFETSNHFSLWIDDTVDIGKCEFETRRATMIIVEPSILVPVTQIVKAFPCVRKAYIST